MANIYSVTQINEYIRGMFDQDFMLRRISVQGEVSNLTYHTSRHIYFTLKDAGGAIKCIMFASDRRTGLGFRMKDGDKVVVSGRIGVYTKGGSYQLYARKIELQGSGILYERYLRLKKEMEERGMFDPMYKQPIPRYVRTVGVVTAPTGAAVQDIRNITHRRNPYVQVILYPALVQGEGAAESIVRGIQVLDAIRPDVIIVGRGGGSIEDLWAFNEEIVAQAIFDCETPVISAVGHQTDFTIADFVADLRAPTPSAAAELAVADIRDILKRIDDSRSGLNTAMEKRIALLREKVGTYTAKVRYLSPENQVREMRQRLMEIGDRIRERQSQAVERDRRRLQLLADALPGREKAVIEQKRHALQIQIQRLDGLSPIRKLNQGYSYAETADGRNISSVDDVTEGDSFLLEVRDGRISGTVTGREKRERAASVGREGGR